MPESVTNTPASLDTGQKPVAVPIVSDQNKPEKNDGQSGNFLNTNQIDLQELSQAPKAQTIQEAKEQRAQDERHGLRNLLMSGMTILAAFLSFGAGLTKTAFGEENILSKAMDALTDKVAPLTLSGFGAFGVNDSLRRKDIGALAFQGMGTVIPVASESNDVTMNRRPEVGGFVFSNEAQRLAGGKEKYGDYTESWEVHKKAMKIWLEKVKENPIRAITDFKSGIAGMTLGGITAASIIPFKLGFRKFGTLMGQIGGMFSELAKANQENLQKGRYGYVLAGILMFLSSAASAVKEFTPSYMHKGIENFTWGFNLFGKQAHLQAINNGELSFTEDTGHHISQAPIHMLRAFFGFNRRPSSQQREKPPIGFHTMPEIKAEVEQKEKQEVKAQPKSSSAYSQTSSYRAPHATKANVKAQSNSSHIQAKRQTAMQRSKAIMNKAVNQVKQNSAAGVNFVAGITPAAALGQGEGSARTYSSRSSANGGIGRVGIPHHTNTIPTGLTATKPAAIFPHARVSRPVNVVARASNTSQSGTVANSPTGGATTTMSQNTSSSTVMNNGGSTPTNTNSSSSGSSSGSTAAPAASSKASSNAA